MVDAPVCNVAPQIDIGTPQQPRMPSIPTPDGSMASIMAAFNALKEGYELLAGQRSGAPMNDSKSPPGSKLKPKQGRWVETGRQTKKVKVVNPQDSEQWVEVLRIEALTLRDTVTGELWTWKR